MTSGSQIHYSYALWILSPHNDHCCRVDSPPPDLLGECSPEVALVAACTHDSHQCQSKEHRNGAYVKNKNNNFEHNEQHYLQVLIESFTCGDPYLLINDDEEEYPGLL